MYLALVERGFQKKKKRIKSRTKSIARENGTWVLSSFNLKEGWSHGRVAQLRSFSANMAEKGKFEKIGKRQRERPRWAQSSNQHAQWCGGGSLADKFLICRSRRGLPEGSFCSRAGGESGRHIGEEGSKKKWG